MQHASANSRVLRVICRVSHCVACCLGKSHLTRHMWYIQHMDVRTYSGILDTLRMEHHAKQRHGYQYSRVNRRFCGGYLDEIDLTKRTFNFFFQNIDMILQGWYVEYQKKKMTKMHNISTSNTSRKQDKSQWK